MKIDVRKLEILEAKRCIMGKEVSKRADISHATYLRIKRGTDKTLPLTVGKIAKALNCDVTELLED